MTFFYKIDGCNFWIIIYTRKRDNRPKNSEAKNSQRAYQLKPYT